jgi:protein-tyrosine phosphatase
VIDLHCHVLPGIDDGPRTAEGSLQLARAAAAAGIERIVATPHVNARARNEAATIGALVTDLNQQLVQAAIAVEVVPGAEVAISYLPDIDRDELARLGLGGGPWLLLEPPFTLVAWGLEQLVLEAQAEGHRVVLAHPERCPALQRDREIVRSLARAGVLMSVTAGSLVGRFGGEVRRYALELAHEGLVHNVTSDAHDAVDRAPGIADELRAAGLSPLAGWLTHEVPEAILAGTDPPPAPARALAEVQAAGRPQRRTWFRRG